MSDFVFACQLGDIPADRALGCDVGGVKVALVRYQDEVFAIRDACSHADVALSEGEVSGCMLECWLHGSQFDLRTGQPTSLPALDPVPIYPTRIIGTSDAASVEICLEPLTFEEIAHRQASIK